MILFQGNLEERILSVLMRVPQMTTIELIRFLQEKDEPVTKQGIYRVLRKLRAEEKITLYKTQVALSRVWIEALRQFIMKKASTSLAGDMTQLREGETLSYRLHGLMATDRLWSELFFSFETSIPNDRPLFLFNPHSWSTYVRPKTDEIHFRQFRSRSRPVFLLIGHKTIFDLKAGEWSKDQGLQVVCQSQPSWGNYVAVLGDICLEIHLLRRSREAMDRIFLESKTINELKTKLTMLDPSIRTHLCIERNVEKARRYKRSMARFFYVPIKQRDY